jgi:hypothetical protein
MNKRHDQSAWSITPWFIAIINIYIYTESNEIEERLLNLRRLSCILISYLYMYIYERQITDGRR